jgi:cholest-4-en-3-one 26-monooxygenase
MTVDLSDPDTYTSGPPYDFFRELRSREPVSWQAERGGRGFWAVTRYHDVISVLRNPQLFSSWRGGALMVDPPPDFLPKLREGMMNRDPPDHTHLRRLVNKALSPRRVEQLDARVSERAAHLVASVRERGACDFAVEVAGEMPLFMISEILGVPGEDRNALYALTTRMLGSEIADPSAALRDQIAAAGEIRAYAAELRKRRLANATDDLSSELARGEVDGRPLTEGEFQAFFMLLFNAGADTTRSMLCFGLDLLIDRPDVIRRLRESPELLPPAIEEIARFVSPAIQMRRTATQDTELAGAHIRENDKVIVFFPSANRDETVFSEPDRFDIDRAPNDHIAFGFGTHFCLGAALARLEARHVFREVLGQLEGIEHVEPIVAARTNFIRGVRHLKIRYAA